MKHILLSIVTIAVLVVFGTCFLLAGQTVLTLFKAHATVANLSGCQIHGLVLTCTRF
jgi:hypothetical protein